MRNDRWRCIARWEAYSNSCLSGRPQQRHIMQAHAFQPRGPISKLRRHWLDLFELFGVFNSRGFYYKLLQRKLGLRPPVSFTAAKVAVPNYLQGVLIVKMQMQLAISMCKRNVANHVVIHTCYISVRKSISWIKLKAIS